MKFINLIILGLMTISFASCAHNKADSLVINEYLSPEPYRIQATETLRIMVNQQSSLTNDYRVNARGQIDFPLLGSVNAAGKTPRELKKLIHHRLSLKYYKNPYVTVETLHYKPIYILGDVHHPGRFSYDPGMNVFDAIATAGGLRGLPSHSRAPQLFILRERAGLQISKVTPATIVSPGDTLVVGKQSLVYLKNTKMKH